MDEKVVYKRKKMKTSGADKAFTVINTIIMTLFLIITLYPILNTLAVSFNDGIDSARGGIHFWPRIFSTIDIYSNPSTPISHTRPKF